jgi:hypothetical protein
VGNEMADHLAENRTTINLTSAHELSFHAAKLQIKKKSMMTFQDIMLTKARTNTGTTQQLESEI